jgi:site-specific DNA-methyltransferase (adenine-specific)
MIHHEDGSVTLHHGDCMEVLKSLPDNSVDSVVTDPPYGLEFMGKDWDAPWKAAGSVLDTAAEAGGFQRESGGNPYSAGRIRYGTGGEASIGFQQWCTLWATECLRVLKPGGHILAFGGSRTWHRLASAIEDAGFEIRDSIAWLYGSGFPKSLDVSKAIDKAAGAEREVVGKYTHPATGKPHADFRTDNDRNAYSSFAMCDDNRNITAPATDAAQRWAGWGTALKPAFEPIVVARKPLIGTVAANVLAHGTGALNIDACRVGDEVLPEMRAGQAKLGTFERADMVTPERVGRWPANVALDEHQAAELDKQSGDRRSAGPYPSTAESDGGLFGHRTSGQPYADSGGASRFFPIFKYTAKAPGTERPTADGVSHPTVKPLDLMRWLVRLVTPPDGVVLEPFAGSGATVEACLREGKRCIAIERETTYLPLILARINDTQLGFDLGA